MVGIFTAPPGALRALGTRPQGQRSGHRIFVSLPRMSTYVFLNVSAHGHINPTLPIVAELVKRGHKVYYLVNESFHSTIKNLGGIPVTVPRIQRRQNAEPPGDKELQLLPFLMARESPRIVPEVIAVLRNLNPDCIVFNTMLLWSRLIAQILHLPAIGFRPFHAPRKARNVTGPFTDPNMSAVAAAAGQALSELTGSFGISSMTLQELVSDVEDLTLVFMPRAFQAEAEQFDKRFLFVGPSFIEPSPATWPLAGTGKSSSKNVYISLGTLRNNDPDFYRKCFSAFQEPGWRVLVSVGDKIDQQTLGPIPENFLIRSSVPQVALLPEVDVFISHGGLNSTMESLYYGVPLVILPSIREQMTTAERVRDLQLGIILDRATVTAEELRAASGKVMQSESIRHAILDMKAQARDAGGYMRAVDAIVDHN